MDDAPEVVLEDFMTLEEVAEETRKSVGYWYKADPDTGKPNWTRLPGAFKEGRDVRVPRSGYRRYLHMKVLGLA